MASFTDATSPPPTFTLVESTYSLPASDNASLLASSTSHALSSSAASCDAHLLHPYALQIGGKHHRQKAGSKGGNQFAKMFLHMPDSHLVYKPVTAGVRGRVELEFYRLAYPHAPRIAAPLPEVLAEPDQQSAIAPSTGLSAVPFCAPFLLFMPQFFGTATIAASSDGTATDLAAHNAVRSEYLRLNDLTRGYRRPNVVDIKMGTQTFDDDAPATKRAMETTKFPDQARLGFRFTGMKVWDAAACDYVEFSKAFCHTLDAASYMRGFRAFFRIDSSDAASTAMAPRAISRVLTSLLAQLSLLLHVFESHNSHRFIASSLLIVYEGDDHAPPSSGAAPPLPTECPLCAGGNSDSGRSSTLAVSRPEDLVACRARAHMIDFGHVTSLAEGARDDGYIHGLRTIVAALQSLIDELASSTRD